MNNLLMFAFRDLEDECSGITRKVLAQHNALKKEFNVWLVGRKGNNILVIHNGEKIVITSNRLIRQHEALEFCKQLIVKEHIKYIYFRRQPCNSDIIVFLKYAKKNGVDKIVWEIPTYPYDTENTSFAGRVRRLVDKVMRNQLKKYVSRILTFSAESEIFGIETINTGNGIEVDSIRERRVQDNGNDLHLIAAAVLRDWHGYDRLIKGMGNYKGKRKVYFHLIGDGPCLNEYKALAKSMNIDDKVIFYGYMKKDEMEDVYDKCDMAVESLGWHRSGVKMGTSIKTREYVAKGMPILASSPMDIFPNGWEYAYYAPIDDSPIDVEKLLDFYDSLIATKSRENLAKEIRKIAYERCEMSSMMQSVVNYYNET